MVEMSDLQVESRVEEPGMNHSALDGESLFSEDGKGHERPVKTVQMTMAEVENVIKDLDDQL